MVAIRIIAGRPPERRCGRRAGKCQAVISVTSVTVDGITTTTITYSDGSTEKTVTGSAKSAALVEMLMRYDAKGMLLGHSSDTSK